MLLPNELSQLYYDYTISAGALVLSPLEKRGGGGGEKKKILTTSFDLATSGL